MTQALPASSVHVWEKRDNPYAVEPPATINFSGGRSSAFMLYRILDHHGGALPDDVEVVFTNTGRERPETLDFVQRCAVEWGVKIRWLEYRYRREAGGGIRDPKNSFEEVSHNSASRDGRPFSELILARNYLPSSTRRFCTEEMKVNTVKRFLRKERGWRKWNHYLGIRYDEKRRWGKILFEDCNSRMPMVYAEHVKSHVTRFWQAAPFDLGISSDRGNCDLCFLKAKKNLVDTLREDPSLADWWIAMEDAVSRMRDTPEGKANSRFSKRDTSYVDLLELARRPDDASLFDGLGEADVIECHCTD